MLKAFLLTGTIAAVVLLLIGTADAQLKYTDDAGNSHWVQTLDQIPEKYRSTTSKPSLPIIMEGDGGGVARD